MSERVPDVSEQRAEIEAVLAAVGSPECNCRSKAGAALDRVRDARDDDEEDLRRWLLRTVGSASSVRSAKRVVERLVTDALARSPQDEDHEALVECGDPANCPQEHVFAHPSPSRDGTVAVEDAAPRVTDLCRCGHQIIAHSATDGCVYCDCDERYVGSAESNEGGNQ